MNLSIIRDRSIGTKVSVFTGLLIVLTVLTLATLATRQARQGLNELGWADLRHAADSVEMMAEMQQVALGDKLRSDLGVAELILAQWAGDGPRWDHAFELDSQTLATVGSHRVPTLRIGEHVLTGDAASVDAVLNRTGSTCTIFTVLPDRWVRTATNVKKDDGARAIGTTLDAASPVYAEVMAGRTYEGINQIAGGWYQTAYRPLWNADGQIVAVLYVGVPIKDFAALRRAIEQIKLGESGYVYVLDLDGKFVIHPTSVGKDVSDLAFVREMLERQQGELHYEWEGRDKLTAFTFFEPFGWVIAAGAYADEFEAASNDVQAATMVAGGVIALIGVVLAALFGRWIGSAVGRVTREVHEVAHGDGDLTRRLPVYGRDELGQLSEAFNGFVAKVNDVVASVTTIAHEVSSASSELAASSQSISGNLQAQTTQTSSASSAVEEMSSSFATVSDDTSTVAQAAEQAGDDARRGGEVVEQTLDGMRQIAEAVGASAQSIETLGQRGEQIGEVIGVINDIADQTNLLALNAAIEAARAGEHGRGFAVVADEVRKLADRTTTATEEVAESIRAIQRETGEAIERMKAGTEHVDQGMEHANAAGEALNGIVGRTTDVATRVRSTADAIAQQTEAAQQIAENIEAINAVSAESAENSAQNVEAVEQLAKRAEEMTSMMVRFNLRAGKVGEAT